MKAQNHVKAPPAHPPPQRSPTDVLFADFLLPQADAGIPSIPFLRQNLNSMPHRLDGGQQGAGGSTKQSRGSDLGPRSRNNHQLSSEDVGRVQRFQNSDHEDQGKGVGSEVCAANQRLRFLGRAYTATPRDFTRKDSGVWHLMWLLPCLCRASLLGAECWKATANYLLGSSVNSECGLGRQARQS